MSLFSQQVSVYVLIIIVVVSFKTEHFNLSVLIPLFGDNGSQNMQLISKLQTKTWTNLRSIIHYSQKGVF